MQDMLGILTAANAIFARGEAATLATVVRVEGSSYRLPGARMLIDAAGERVGMVSGGCLEADVARRGRLLTAAEPYTLVRYDGSDEDVAWSFGLGCNGSIEVFIQRLEKLPQAFEFMRQCHATRTVGEVVTVFSVQGETGAKPGDTLCLTVEDLRRYFPSDSDSPLLRAGVMCLEERETMTVTYMLESGDVQMLVEAVKPPPALVIYGAGQDAMPLVRAAKALGWHVTVWDRRPSYARADRFPEADVVLSGEAAAIALTSDSVGVVMTHHYPDDRELLPMLLNSPAQYIGMLGPRARTERILGQMGASQTNESLERLHAPIGLDIGAEGSDQVALSIVAEILATLNRRSGEPLRERVGPIHSPAPMRVVSTGRSADVIRSER